LVVHRDPINTIAISCDGKLFASGGDDGFLLIFNAKSLRELKRFRVPSPVRAIVWHPAQPEFVTYGTASGVVSTLAHNARYTQFQRTMPGTVHCLAIRFDGEFLAVGFHNEVAIV
ncbi:WD40-repeat-containing domain protein, partial [Mycena olivaceomarginata]